VCLRVTGSAAELLIAGDALHHPLQLREPRRSTRYCVDPARAAASRGQLLVTLAESGTTLLPAHFPAPSAGRLTPDDGGYRFVPAIDLLRTDPYTPASRGSPPPG